MRGLVMVLIFGAALTVSLNGNAADRRFEGVAEQYIQKLLSLSPQWATDLGEHRYDHYLGDYSQTGVDEDRAFQAAFLDSLSGIDPALLSATNRIDYEILLNQIKSSIFETDTIQGYRWNPLRYNLGGAIYSLVARDFAPLETRLTSVIARLRQVPDVLAQARINLHNPPRIHTETAIRQNKGTIDLVSAQLNSFFEQVPTLQAEFKRVQDSAVAALQEYGVWLEKDLLPRSNGEFRLGPEKYRARLRYTLESELSPEEILRNAEADLTSTQAQIYATAMPLYARFYPGTVTDTTPAGRSALVRKVLDRLAEQHPTAADVVQRAQAALQECQEFVRAKDLVTVPTTPINVIVMPEFDRGVAVAYCNSPGPLETGQKTFFSISPPPSDWTDAQVESFLREYNDHMLRDLTVHEAMPGHYLQGAHSNQFKAPTLVRSIFGSGPFTEGWACYSEQLMAEQGFGGPEFRMQQLKMRLRLIINAIIDQQIHTAGMTEPEAMDLMVNQGYQEQSEAAGKWRRACLGSTQLSTYYVGLLEMNNLRRAWEAKHRPGVDLKQFHDTLLSFGTPAPKYVKELMGL